MFLAMLKVSIKINVISLRMELIYDIIEACSSGMAAAVVLF